MTKGCERAYALKVLEDITTKELFANQVLEDYFFVYDFDKQQRSFISRVVYGTIEQMKYIDFCINHLSKIKVNKMKPLIRHILRMSVYQLLFMDKVPSHAVINEAVKLVEKRKHFQLKGFVNGVLRSVERSKDEFPKLIAQLPIQERLSVGYSINSDLVGYLLKQYSKDELESFLEESLKQKETCLRTNTQKIQSDELKAKLMSVGQVKPGHLLETSFYLSDYDDIMSIEAFKAGEFQIQDESSTLVGLVANPLNGQSIIDVCAAPGGKTTHVAQLLEGSGSVIACDISETKLTKIQENLDRLGLKNVKTKFEDASSFNVDYDKAFDIVLADVPCSGLGLLRSKPDIKLNMTVDKIKTLIPIQQSILENVAKYVKIGGSLVYSTCTINKKENRFQVDEFLNKHPEFELDDLSMDTNLPQKVNKYIVNGCIELITNENLTDGFFIARLKRKEV